MDVRNDLLLYYETNRSLRQKLPKQLEMDLSRNKSPLWEIIIHSHLTICLGLLSILISHIQFPYKHWGFWN